MKLEFEVWVNAKGELHITCDSSQLEKPINIRGKDNLESTRVLRNAVTSDKYTTFACIPCREKKHAECSHMKNAIKNPYMAPEVIVELQGFSCECYTKRKMWHHEFLESGAYEDDARLSAAQISGIREVCKRHGFQEGNGGETECVCGWPSEAQHEEDEALHVVMEVLKEVFGYAYGPETE